MIDSSQRPLMRSIPSSGEKIPVVGLGTWQTFDVGSSESDRKPLKDVLNTFVEMGGALVDSSPMYRRSEEVVGSLASDLQVRDRLFLATKVWTTGSSAGLKQMNESLEKMQVSSIDLMQIHNLVDVDTHLQVLADWKKQKRVRYIGVTHYTASALDDLMRVMRSHRLDFVQINYSVAEREADERLLPLAQELGVAVIINRPFATGALLSNLQKRPLPDWAADIGCTTWAQILVKFVISHPAVTCVIPATSRVEHLRDNLKAASEPLPDMDLRRRIVSEAS